MSFLGCCIAFDLESLTSVLRSSIFPRVLEHMKGSLILGAVNLISVFTVHTVQAATCPSVRLNVNVPSIVKPTRAFRAKFKVTNTNRNVATGLALTVTLPIEFTLFKASPAPSNTLNPWSLVYGDITLGPLKSMHVVVRGLVGECFQGSMTFNATVAVPADNTCAPVTAARTVRNQIIIIITFTVFFLFVSCRLCGFSYISRLDTMASNFSALILSDSTCGPLSICPLLLAYTSLHCDSSSPFPLSHFPSYPPACTASVVNQRQDRNQKTSLLHDQHLSIKRGLRCTTAHFLCRTFPSGHLWQHPRLGPSCLWPRRLANAPYIRPKLPGGSPTSGGASLRVFY